MVRSLVFAAMLLWTSLAVAQTVPGRFPPGTVYGNPNAVGGAEANPSTVQTFATRWPTASRPASPVVGAFGFNTTIGGYDFWNGGGDWGNVLLGPIRNASVPGLPGGAYGSSQVFVNQGSLNVYNQYPYGYGNSASVACFMIANFSATVGNQQGACPVNGGAADDTTPSGSGWAQASSRDTSGLVVFTVSQPPLFTPAIAGTFTATQFIPTVALSGTDVAKLRIGMPIDTDDTPTPRVGKISGWAANGTSITVTNWFTQNCVGGGCTTVTPTGTHATISKQWKQWPTLFGTQRLATSDVKQTVVSEFDVGNYSGVDDTTNNNGGGLLAGVPSDGGLDVVNIGTNRASFGALVRGKFVAQLNLYGDSTDAAIVSTQAGSTVSNGFNVAPAASGTVTNAFNVTANDTGQGTVASAILNYTGPAAGGVRVLEAKTAAGNRWLAQTGIAMNLGAQSPAALTPYLMRFWSSGNGANNNTSPDAILSVSNGTGASDGDTQLQTGSLTVSALRNIILGTGSPIATNAVNGLIQIPTMAGTPTGTVGAAGKAAAVIDTTNKKWCYSTGSGTWECSGATPPTWTTAGRPASPAQGTFGLNTDTDTIEYFGGVTNVVSATVAAGGTSGCTGPTATVAGTTGTGVRFIASVGVTAGQLSGAVTILSSGSYTTNPTLAGEPVISFGGPLGCSTTPTFNLTMSNAWNAVKGGKFEVAAWGAKCDNTADDSTAINNMLAAARLSFQWFGSRPVEIAFPPNKSCRFASTLNFAGNSDSILGTGFTWKGVVVTGTGSTLYCTVSGAACIDAMGTRFMTWRDITMITDGTNIPTYGIQIGRITLGGCDTSVFSNVTIFGYFSIANFYDAGCEQMSFDNNYFSNKYTGTGPGGFALIVDGMNHWNPPTLNTNTRTFTTDSTNQTFDNTSFKSGTFANSSANVGSIWIGAAGGAVFSGQTYSVSNSPCNVEMYFLQNDFYANDNRMVFEGHFEIATYAFCLKGTATAPIIRGFRYAYELGSQATTALFHIDPGSSITSVSMFDLDLQYTNAPQVVPAVAVFAEPAKWSNVTGYLKLPASTSWVGSQPVLFTGTVCFQPPAYVPSGAQINAAQCSDYPGTISFGQQPVPTGLQAATIATSGTGGSYTQGDRLTIAGGSGPGAFQAVLAVTRTQVRTATVTTTGGSGCTVTSGTTIEITGTTGGTGGAGTPFKGTLPVVGGGGTGTVAVGAVATLTGGANTTGTYSVNPTALTTTPYTITGPGACTTPPRVDLTMGARVAYPVVTGNYTVPPATTTITQSAAPASGATGATWTPSWSFFPAVSIDYTNTALNTAIGIAAGANQTSAANNTFLGGFAGFNTTTGGINTGIGASALVGTTTGFNNTAVGYAAGSSITTGALNLLLGNNVGSTVLTTGNWNILIGGGNNCTTTASNTSNQFKVCAQSGATDLMVGDMTAGALKLAVNGALTVGVAGSVVGTTAFANATSGTITLQPATGALTGVLTLPNKTANVGTTTGATVVNNCAKFSDTTGNVVDAGVICTPLAITTVYGTGTVTHTFNTSTAFVRFSGCAGGAGGGSGGKQVAATAMAGGGGGGGSSCFDRTFRTSDLGSSVVLVVGTGGAGGTAPGGSSAVVGANGVAGGPTCVGATGMTACTSGTVYAVAGPGGFGAGGTLASASTGGGAGGCTVLTTSTANYTGGNASGATAGAACNSGAAGGSGANGITINIVGFGAGGGGSSNAAAFFGGFSNSLGAGGGGSGGTVIGTPTGTSGNGGGAGWATQTSNQPAGGTSGTPTGGSGSAVNCTPGSGGGGGYSSSTGVGSNGGSGANGGGGGGGGSSVTTQAAGNGGNGGNGFICVFETI